MKYIKYSLDFIVALLLSFLLFPLFIALCTVTYLFISRDVFFTQKRPGKNEKIFTIIKFKTMNDNKDSSGELLPDHERLTPLGKVIRSLSLDEIPQLINIMKGELSFVGPRPLLVEYLEHYNDFQKRRHNVRPGITGWAQVNGRNDISWEEKFKLDIWYIDNWSLFLDFKIIFLTMSKVLFRVGIVPTGKQSVEKFKGSSQ